MSIALTEFSAKYGFWLGCGLLLIKGIDRALQIELDRRIIASLEAKIS